MDSSGQAHRSESAGIRRSLTHGVYLTVCGNLLMAAILGPWAAPRPVITLLGAHAALAAGVFAFLRFRPRLTAGWVNALDALLIVPYFLSIWVAQGRLELAGLDHLLAPKLLAFGWAFVVPKSYRLHALFILGLGVEGVLIWFRQQALGATTAAAEPGFTVLAVWMALSLLVLRYRQRAYEHQVVELRTRNAVLSEVAGLILRVRDRANSPLQRLVLAGELLERGRPASAAVVASIRQSVAELEALHAQFQGFEPFVAWQPEHLRLDPERKTEGE
jgi:hypothetical protein